MTRKAPLRFEPEALDFELTQEERAQLVGFALGRALLWAAGAGAIWFALRGFISSSEPAMTGFAFAALVFVVVFFWKRRTYRKQMTELFEDAKRKHLNETENSTTER